MINKNPEYWTMYEKIRYMPEVYSNSTVMVIYRAASRTKEMETKSLLKFIERMADMGSRSPLNTNTDY